MTLEEHRSRLVRYAEVVAELGHRPAKSDPLSRWITNLMYGSYAQAPAEVRVQARAVFDSALTARMWAQVQAVAAALVADSPGSLHLARLLATQYDAGQFSAGQRAMIDAALPADWRARVAGLEKPSVVAERHRRKAAQLREFVQRVGRLPLKAEDQVLAGFVESYLTGQVTDRVPAALRHEVRQMIESAAPPGWHRVFTAARAAVESGAVRFGHRRWLLSQHQALEAGHLNAGQQRLLQALPAGWLESLRRQEARAASRASLSRQTESNLHRRAQAADRAVVQARAALRLCTQPEARQVLKARVTFPDASLSELAARCGMSKDAYSGRLRRSLQLAVHAE